MGLDFICWDTLDYKKVAIPYQNGPEYKSSALMLNCTELLL